MNHGGEKLLNKTLNSSEIKKVEKLRDEKSKTSDAYNVNKDMISLSKQVENMDINGYSKVYKIDESIESEKSGKENKIKDVFGNFKIKKENNETVEVDISEDIKKYFEKNILKYDANNYFQNNNEIEKENYKIIIERLFIIYNVENNDIYDYTIEGYLLEK